MAIDRSGQRRPEMAAAELDAYLREFRAGGYPVARVVHVACARCGGSVFGGCTADGVLGVYADWKIDYSPSGYLRARV
ncbi:MAG TPA: hypothetical protein VFX61_00935 [Micromonosporaceae bacterium]|nr:hypothetical protein [Micromonosporaceae bacterium]